MQAVREAIYSTFAADHPMTIRQAYYRLSVDGIIAKTEAEYKGTVCRLTAEMRRSGEIPYEWVADSTRWMRKPTTYSSAEAALRRTAETYRRSLWDESDTYVEVWLEKEALAGVLVEVTDEWDVPLMVTRGYPSMSFLHSAAEAIRARAWKGQHTRIYYFGDRDPSGVDIDRAVVQGIGESLMALELEGMYETPEEAFECNATFERVAVTEHQIEEWRLPTRPTKKTDTRSKGFEGESVEVDAIPSHLLRRLAEDCIEQHVNRYEHEVLQKAEAEERRILEQMAATLDGGDS
jgi:hypothetical protein